MHTATPEIYTLSLHDALPIYFRDQIFGQLCVLLQGQRNVFQYIQVVEQGSVLVEDAHLLVKQSDRKSTRLNSSHVRTSYAVFCLKKKRILGGQADKRGAHRGG